MTSPKPASEPVRSPRAVPRAIGWRERIDLPDWGIRNLIAKIDTGARTSAIDVEALELLPRRRVRFRVHLSRNHRHLHKTVEAKLVRDARVRSSLGHVHERLLVRTTIRIGPFEKEIEIGLVSRPDMLCRVLLGRSALEHDFVVDPARRYLLSGSAKTRRAAARPGVRKSAGKDGSP